VGGESGSADTVRYVEWTFVVVIIIFTNVSSRTSLIEAAVVYKFPIDLSRKQPILLCDYIGY
jgi:hypothetical protein